MATFLKCTKAISSPSRLWSVNTAGLYCVEEWNTASEEADRLNTLYGHTDTAAARVIASSMAAGKLPKTSQEAPA